MKLVRFLMKLNSETVTVEVKNGSSLNGTIVSVSPSMNIMMKNIKLIQPNRDPISMTEATIRGNTIRNVLLPDHLNLDSLLVDSLSSKSKNRNIKKQPVVNTRGRGGFRGRGGSRGRGRAF